jgi:lipid-binding SYLF domain-containing protein
MKKFLQLTCLALVTSVAAHAATDIAKLDQRIEAAHEVLHELMATPDRGIPDSVAEHATCVAVIPGFKKGAFLVGAEYGQGIVTCRTGHGWSAPAFIKLTGASFGFQVGGESTSLVLVSVTHDGAERLLHDHVKLGGDIAVAAGPVGRDSQASTTDLANAGFLTYSRSKGVFAGVDLNGDVVNQNTDDTIAYYGHDASFERILHGNIRPRPSSMHFLRTVNELFHASQTGVK